MEQNRKVALTGIGVVSPYGIGKECFWRGLQKGSPAIRRISLFNPEGFLSQVGGEVPDLNGAVVLEGRKELPRVVPMAILAAREALQDAEIDTTQLEESEKEKWAVIVGTGAGGIDYAEQQYEGFHKEGSHRIHPYAISNSFPGMLSSELSIYFGFRGPSHVMSNGCTSSTDAIGYAFQSIRRGERDCVLTGGAEACMTRGILSGFCRMKVVSSRFNNTPERASRPFDKERDGFVLGEGAWFFVLESFEQARRRGARIYCFVSGYGATCDAFHPVRTTKDGKESARAMVEAVKDAGLALDEIDYINLHGTSTVMNDRTETAAVKLAFEKKSYAIPMSATKSLVGHPQGASGAMGVATCALSLANQFITPTANYETPDEACDLDYTPNRGRETVLRHVLSNCIGFGSKNASLVLSGVGA